MLKQTIIAAALAGAAVAVGPTGGVAQQAQQPGPAQVAQCLHGRPELGADRSRRESALRVARQITLAEAERLRSIGKYSPLRELFNVRPAPDGFAVSLNYGDDSYSFSIKDTRDACHYAIFSDQDGYVYDGTPLTGTVILPAN